MVQTEKVNKSIIMVHRGMIHELIKPQSKYIFKEKHDLNIKVDFSHIMRLHHTSL